MIDVLVLFHSLVMDVLVSFHNYMMKVLVLFHSFTTTVLKYSKDLLWMFCSRDFCWNFFYYSKVYL